MTTHCMMVASDTYVQISREDMVKKQTIITYVLNIYYVLRTYVIILRSIPKIVRSGGKRYVHTVTYLSKSKSL